MQIRNIFYYNFFVKKYGINIFFENNCFSIYLSKLYLTLSCGEDFDSFHFQSYLGVSESNEPDRNNYSAVRFIIRAAIHCYDIKHHSLPFLLLPFYSKSMLNVSHSTPDSQLSNTLQVVWQFSFFLKHLAEYAENRFFFFNLSNANSSTHEPLLLVGK